MDLDEAAERLLRADAMLAIDEVAPFFQFDTPHGPLMVLLTARLRRRCKRQRIWRSTALRTALKNARYGFAPLAARSRGGSDGIFRLNRDFEPPNAMMKKLFDRFIDKPDPLVATLAGNHLFGTPSDWIPVRLVSHPIRLLGVLSNQEVPSKLALVDFDLHERG